MNEQTARGGATPVYDEVGNLTDNDEDQRYVYDAWGRLVEVRNQSSALISRHRYNGLGYRIAWQYDLDADGTVETSNSNHDPWLYLVHDPSWRVVATVFAVDDGAGRESGEHLAKADDDPRELFVFHTGGANGRGGSSRLDDVILRDRDANTTWGNAGDGTAEERTYYAQNWRGDVVALLDSSGGRRETIAYSAFGVPFGRPGADANGDGTASTLDFNMIVTAFGESYGDPNYSVVADINLDGSVNALDANLYSAQSGYTLGRGTLSRNPSLSGGVGNRVGYAGYAWEPSASKYHVRNRVLDPVRGRWNRRDTLGYIDGPTMYAYVSNRAMSAVDPSGLFQRNLPQVQPVCPKVTEEGGDDQFALGECVGMGGAGPGADLTTDRDTLPSCPWSSGSYPSCVSCCDADQKHYRDRCNIHKDPEALKECLRKIDNNRTHCVDLCDRLMNPHPYPNPPFRPYFPGYAPTPKGNPPDDFCASMAPITANQKPTAQQCEEQWECMKTKCAEYRDNNEGPLCNQGDGSPGCDLWEYINRQCARTASAIYEHCKKSVGQ